MGREDQGAEGPFLLFHPLCLSAICAKVQRADCDGSPVARFGGWGGLRFGFLMDTQKSKVVP